MRIEPLIRAGKTVYDVWQVNQDAEYHESGDAGQRSGEQEGLRMVPRGSSSVRRGT
jgi:hypothetical protein